MVGRMEWFKYRNLKGIILLWGVDLFLKRVDLYMEGQSMAGHYMWGQYMGGQIIEGETIKWQTIKGKLSKKKQYRDNLWI